MNNKGYSFYNQLYAISVCRIEPENNIHLILDAFSRQSVLHLVIVGNWDNSIYGQKLFKKYAQFDYIHLLNPVYDSTKINLLRSMAFIYIHGHSAGGTNPSLVEAMFLGLPVFAFSCVYNRYTTEEQCVYWSNTDELYNYITKYDELGLDVIGMNMKSIATKRFQWRTIVSKYEALFFQS